MQGYCNWNESAKQDASMTRMWVCQTVYVPIGCAVTLALLRAQRFSNSMADSRAIGCRACACTPRLSRPAP